MTLKRLVIWALLVAALVAAGLAITLQSPLSLWIDMAFWVLIAAVLLVGAFRARRGAAGRTVIDPFVESQDIMLGRSPKTVVERQPNESSQIGPPRHHDPLDLPDHPPRSPH